MNTCQVSTLKAHSLGRTYSPRPVLGRWQLKNNEGDALIGFRGTVYNFKTEKFARDWLCSNLGRWQNADEETSPIHMAKLAKIYSETREQYIINEIEAIQSYQLGEWDVVDCMSVQIITQTDFNVDGGNAFTIY
jgi:hypothetical protein